MAEPQALYFYGHTRNRPFKEFSQFFEAPFVDEQGTFYRFAEQWMMVQKARLMGDLDAVPQMLSAEEPGKVKRLGRRVRNWDQRLWDANKYRIVLEGTRLKFGQNARLRQLLLSTGRRRIAEAPRGASGAAGGWTRAEGRGRLAGLRKHNRKRNRHGRNPFIRRYCIN